MRSGSAEVSRLKIMKQSREFRRHPKAIEGR